MKKFIYIIGVFAIIIYFYGLNKKNNDWSKINALVENECKINGIYKDKFWVDFHKLPWDWDEFNYFTGGNSSSFHELLGDSYKMDVSCEYIVLSKNKKVQKVLAQCFDSDFDYVDNWDNNVFIRESRDLNTEEMKKKCKEGVFLFNYKGNYEKTRGYFVKKYEGNLRCVSQSF